MQDKDVLAAVDAILESLKETIVENGRLEIRDFGVFTVKQRKGRVGRNPGNNVSVRRTPSSFKL
jgi:nucleoid DNA-binding protein